MALFCLLFQRYASALLLSMTLDQFIKATKKRFLFCIKNRPGFHCGNRGGSFVLLVLFQALTPLLAGIFDSSLSGCQNYRALGKNDNTFLSSRKSYSRNISCSIVTPYCKILSFLCKKAAAPEKPARQLFLQEPVPRATGRTSRRNTLIYQRRQRSPSGTFQCRHQSEGGGSSAPAPYMARWQCVHRPVRSP